MTDFPRLRWLALLQIVVTIATSIDTGSILQALTSAGVLAPGALSMILFALRAARAYSQVDDDTVFHTMPDGGRSVNWNKPAGFWERVW